MLEEAGEVQEPTFRVLMPYSYSCWETSKQGGRMVRYLSRHKQWKNRILIRIEIFVVGTLESAF